MVAMVELKRVFPTDPFLPCREGSRLVFLRHRLPRVTLDYRPESCRIVLAPLAPITQPKSGGRRKR
jgi:hypothetical protein